MVSKTTRRLAAAIAISLLVGGCGRDNGLPTDLIAHLAAHGIHVRAVGSRAPLSSRAGFVFFDRSPTIEAKIVTGFHLEKIEPQDPPFSLYAGQIAEKPVSLWGTAGRPGMLKPRDGAQFDYLSLLIAEGRSYLFAEYACG